MYYLRFFLCFISKGLMGLIGLKSSWSWLVIQNVLFKLSNLKLPTEPLRFMVKWFLTNKTDNLPIVCRQFLKVPLSNPVEQKHEFCQKRRKIRCEHFHCQFLLLFFPLLFVIILEAFITLNRFLFHIFYEVLVYLIIFNGLLKSFG